MGLTLKTAMRVQQITEKLLGPPDECTLDYFVKKLREFENTYGQLPKSVLMSPEDAQALAVESHLQNLVKTFTTTIYHIYGVTVEIEYHRIPGHWEWVWIYD